MATLRLSTTSVPGVQKGSFGYRPRLKGRFVVTYAGTTVNASLRDTRSTDVARVLIR